MKIVYNAIKILFFTCLITSPAFSQTEGPLGDLFMAKEGALAHYSSYDSTGGNADFKRIEPGQTLVLANHKGAGVLRRWWLTIAPWNLVDVHRSLIIRCYWDGEKEPSVEVPVSDFFGMGFGEWKDFQSTPLNMTSGGYNSYWPMPFHRSAYITVENRGTTPVSSFYYNIDIRTYNKLPKDALYFHAQYKQERTVAGKPLTILQTTGRGHYVGTLISMQPRQGNHLGYLEGDEIIFIDGEKNPSIIGTGTEDYFSSGWYYNTGEYSAPYHGATVKDDSGRINTYRWHIEDPIPFKKSFRFDMEHGGTNDMPGVEYTSVAYWYQDHPGPSFPALPKNLMPHSQTMTPSIEGESLLTQARVTGGQLRVQETKGFKGTWGNDSHLWWVEAKPGDKLTIPITAPEAGTYELIGFFTQARDYGIFRTSVNGKLAGHLFDGFSTDVVPSGPISFGTVPLQKGTNQVVIEIIGKDARSAGYSDGYLVGIDGFHLEKQ
ncbi:DUF2961 domain-containing protein [Aridibaculum aurantiacum]|uniref:DUF2961 domain-containing protein n=1 Tax=Aridibaculum aurantiacum TaxID=2810307 RepID=UPI001A974BD9|nr:DUF2961 domain-containing protein [Aridibaculum aurantiacum]